MEKLYKKYNNITIELNPNYVNEEALQAIKNGNFELPKNCDNDTIAVVYSKEKEISKRFSCKIYIGYILSDSSATTKNWYMEVIPNDNIQKNGAIWTYWIEEYDINLINLLDLFTEALNVAIKYANDKFNK